MTDARWRSPLAHRAAVAGAGIRLAERPYLQLWSLRGDPMRIAVDVQTATGLRLPRAARQTARAGEFTALWLAPDEWLLHLAANASPAPVSALAAALAERHHQLVEVSDYYTGIELAGARVRDLLAKLVAVDLHRRHFGAGEVVGTLLAKASVQLWMTADEAMGEPRVLVLVRRSLADYVWCLLAEAGREWGAPTPEPIGRVQLHHVAAAP